MTNTHIPSAKLLISGAASVASASMLIRSFYRDILLEDFRHQLGREVGHFLSHKLKSFLSSLFSVDVTLVFPEIDAFDQNHLFKAAQTYLGPIQGQNANRFKAIMLLKENHVSLSLDPGEVIVDTFNGAKMKWVFETKLKNSMSTTETRCLELRFHKRHKQMVLETYLPYIVQRSKELEGENKTLKLFTLKPSHYSAINAWMSVNLDHPTTFATLAMDMEMKKMIMEDLERFVKRKEFYRKVGKAWKRGYLLFGPSGTGKSSLVAAMANFLKFDVYDLELTAVSDNSDFRNLLISTSNQSILVVEDIDCTGLGQSRSRSSRDARQPNEVTLSGLLNFIDGLWSSCGDQRLIVFTTNHKDKLDPALLRPGRMDLHIFMSYCTPSGFRIMASNYLGITDHSLFSEVEELVAATNVTPAEVGEQLMKSEVPEIALASLLEFLEAKKRDQSTEPESNEAELGSHGVEGIQKKTETNKEMSRSAGKTQETTRKMKTKEVVLENGK